MVVPFTSNFEVGASTPIPTLLLIDIIDEPEPKLELLKILYFELWIPDVNYDEVPNAE